jgi:hypothetical protein
VVAVGVGVSVGVTTPVGMGVGVSVGVTTPVGMGVGVSVGGNSLVGVRVGVSLGETSVVGVGDPLVGQRGSAGAVMGKTKEKAIVRSGMAMSTALTIKPITSSQVHRGTAGCSAALGVLSDRFVAPIGSSASGRGRHGIALIPVGYPWMRRATTTRRCVS